MEEALEKLVMEKMARVESHYPSWLKKYELPDNIMHRLGYYQTVGSLFAKSYAEGEFDDFESRMMEELGALIIYLTSRIQNELRKDLQL